MKSGLFKIAVSILILLYVAPLCVFAQDDEEEYVPDRIVMWNKVGQRETFKKCEEYLVIYVDAEPEMTYVKYIESRNDDEYILELSTHSNQSKPKPIDLTQSVVIPADGSSPIPYKDSAPNAARSLVFSNLGQREKVYNGEVININYEDLNTDKVYISYESTEDGYWLELSSLTEQKVLSFTKRCQSFIVASPSNSTVRYLDEIRYEQIVWTARKDGSWEVRIGTTQQGCRSEALDRIKYLRTREYEKKVPVEKKNKKR